VKLVEKPGTSGAICPKNPPQPRLTAQDSGGPPDGKIGIHNIYLVEGALSPGPILGDCSNASCGEVDLVKMGNAEKEGGLGTVGFET